MRVKGSPQPRIALKCHYKGRNETCAREDPTSATAQFGLLGLECVNSSRLKNGIASGTTSISFAPVAGGDG